LAQGIYYIVIVKSDNYMSLIITLIHRIQSD